MTFKRTVSTLAVCAAALLLEAPANAAVYTVQNYYEEKVSMSCPSDAYSCRLNFTKTPSGKYLTIVRVSCYIERTLPLRIMALAVADTPSGLTSRSFPMTFQANTTGNGLYYYNTNQETYYRINQSRYPFVVAETSSPSNGYISCTIQGDLSNP